MFAYFLPSFITAFLPSFLPSKKSNNSRFSLQRFFFSFLPSIRLSFVLSFKHHFSFLSSKTFKLNSYMNLTGPKGCAIHSGWQAIVLQASIVSGFESVQSLGSTSYSTPSAATCIHLTSRVRLPPLQVLVQSSHPSAFHLNIIIS